MRGIIKKIICIMLVTVLFVSTTSLASNIANNSISIEEKNTKENNLYKTEMNQSVSLEDMDELVDLEITVTIKEIRALDKIDLFGEADFYVKVFINGEEWWTTKTWKDQNYVEAYLSNTVDVPDEEEFVNITIQLWDDDPILDKLCDIDGPYTNEDAEKRYIDLSYNLKTGHWMGDDFNTPDIIWDDSGYGRACGCDDNTYNIEDRDCELTFDITQNDFDGDGIPWWTEVYFYGTDPEVDNTGMDDDEDGVPIEWEHKWGHSMHRHHGVWEHYWTYNPFEWEDHENLDPDHDGLQNVEEYLTSQWGSDPFRQDIFLELDQMEIKDDKGSYVPLLSLELLRDAFSKHNIVFHIDHPWEDEMTGGEIIPFMEQLHWDDQQIIYNDYFLHDGLDKWRQGIFHYGVLVYAMVGAAGFAFWGGDESYPYADGILIATRYHDNMSKRTIENILNTKILNDELRRVQVYASVIMHETGHILGVHNGNTKGCDNRQSYLPWQKGWWKFANYKSCMNYRYVLEIVDYSDGSHGKNDFDDWKNIDLTRFQGT